MIPCIYPLPDADFTCVFDVGKFGGDKELSDKVGDIHTYEFVSVVIHTGMYRDEGQYIAATKSAGRWSFQNDVTVREVRFPVFPVAT